MIPIERTCCAITHANDLEPLYRFESFPVFMGCTHDDPSTDVVMPMDWWISRSSGLIQLKSLVPLEMLYMSAHGSGCIGKLWEQHHEAFAQFIAHYHPKGVIEIGGGHGILSQAYHQGVDAGVQWTIVEPNPTPATGVKATYIKGFFDETFSFDGDYDAIVHSHVFEHMYKPDAFIQHLAKFSQEGKMHLFSVPNIAKMLERKYTNGINFEHTLSLTEPYMEYLLAKHGFRIQAKQYFMEDHSIFYATVRYANIEPVSLGLSLYETNKKLYFEYVSYHLDLVETLNQKIQASDSPVFLFGAHVFSQYLIAFGLDTTRLTGLLDNDSAKQGKRLYGTSLQVYSPQVLATIKEPAVILKAGVYNEEIKREILDNISASTIFLE